MKGTLIFHQKSKIHDHYVLELEIFEIEDPVRYPDRIKYSLICLNSKTGQKVLFDNHHPKGHHLHLDNRERPYHFRSVPTLMADFVALISKHLGIKI